MVKVSPRASSPPPTTKSADNSSISKAKKNKKNKKKQQKKAAKNTAQDVSELSMKELDDMLDNLKTSDASGATAGSSCATENTASSDPEDTLTPTARQLLSVNSRFLDSEAEMKRMFGSRVVNREARPSGR
jgi:membrane protein involved in colicin uptake